MGLNNINLQGNLTRDPVLTETQNSQVCKFSIAFSHKKKDVEEVDYIEVNIWGSSAKACSDHLVKGSPVIVSGKLRSEKWEDKSGNKQVKWFVFANEVIFLPRAQRIESAPMPLGKDKIKSFDPNTGQGDFDFDAPPF